jgi:hypothetical protein
MTICELKELGSKIQAFLNSQDVELTKSSGMGKANTRLQEILISLNVNIITRSELEQLGLKVREILLSHDMKLIKYRGQRNTRSKRDAYIHNHPENLVNRVEFNVYTQC